MTPLELRTSWFRIREVRGYPGNVLLPLTNVLEVGLGGYPGKPFQEIYAGKVIAGSPCWKIRAGKSEPRRVIWMSAGWGHKTGVPRASGSGAALS